MPQRTTAIAHTMDSRNTPGFIPLFLTHRIVQTRAKAPKKFHICEQADTGCMAHPDYRRILKVSVTGAKYISPPCQCGCQNRIIVRIAGHKIRHEEGRHYVGRCFEGTDIFQNSARRKRPEGLHSGVAQDPLSLSQNVGRPHQPVGW